MNQPPPYHIELLKKKLMQQQMFRKRLELQLQNQKRIQQRIQQKIREEENKIKSPKTSEDPHIDVLTVQKQVELLNNESFLSSLLNAKNPSRNTLTIQMGPKPILQPKITPPIKPSIPEKPIEEILPPPPPREDNFVESFLKEHSNEIKEEDELVKEEKFYSIPPSPQLPKNSPKIPFVQIYGSFNTGTNLLTVLFEKLFQIYIPRVGSAKKWKHTLEIQNFPNYFHILFVKNPFSWFQSMLKESYNLVIPNRQKLLHQAVLMKQHHDPWNGDSFSRHFSSISKVWLYYYQMYMNFAIKHQNSIVISYEEILYDNDRLLKYFSEIFKLPLPKNFEKIRDDAMKRPAKAHGKCNNLNRALKANQLESLFTKYTADDVKRFFEDVPMKLIIPHHQRLWDLQKWKDHFQIE